MLKNKLFASAFALALVLGGASIASAAYSFPNTIDTKQEKMDVQTVLNMNGATLTVDGVFGAKTTAAVKAFQTLKGLTADGKIGPMTRAALEAAQVATTTPVTTTPVAGCPAGALFNSLTGAACTATATTPASTTLAGGAGDITITKSSTDIETQVAEGKTENVLGFKVEATDSDIAVKNVKLTLENSSTKVTAGGSYRLSDYASKVEIYMGSTLVGSADVADFTKDVHTYSKSISLNGATVKMGSSNKATFYVKVVANSTIDSTDIDNNDWTATIDNTRFQDATGVILTDNTAVHENFEFTNLAGIGDLKLTVTKGTNSPVAQTVKVSDSGVTEVLMSEFKIKATGSDLSFDQVALTIASTVDASHSLSDMISELVIKDGSSQIGSINTTFASDTDSDSDTTGTQAYTFDLDNTYKLNADATATFKIYAKVADIDQFVSGSLKVDVKDNGINAEDTNGDLLSGTENSGSVTGTIQTFVFDVPTVTLVSTPTLALYSHTDGTGSTELDTYKATVVFKVTAPENQEIFLPLDTFAFGTAGTQGVEYTTNGAAVSSATLVYSGTDNLDEDAATKTVRIEAGASQEFTFTSYLTGNDLQGKVTVSSVWYETSNVATDGTPSIDSGFTNFKTPLVLLSK